MSAGAFLAALFSIHGFFDGYYAWNGHDPRSHRNFVPGSGTTAERANQPGLNVAALDLVSDARPIGLHLTLVAGDSAEVVHAGEPGRHFRHLYQASASYKAPVGRGLLLEGGVYPSHIGLESFFSKDNWNYTRSWLSEFSPYYQTGIKASYAWSSRWSGELHVLRGWQLIGENNEAKSFGTQIAYSSQHFSASFNTFVGPELAKDNKHLRVFGDVVATWKATPKLTVGGSFDRGHQQLPGNAANWFGFATYTRYAFNDRRAVAFRAERFRDPDHGISGTSQTLTETTLTYEVHPVRRLIVKIEGRRDHSTAPVFNGSPDQALVIVGAVTGF